MNLWEQFQETSPLNKVLIGGILAGVVGLCVLGFAILGLVFLQDEPAPPPIAVATEIPATPVDPTPLPTPVVITGWQGEYFDNPELQGEPVVVRDDEFIDFDWGCSPPAPGVEPTNFSVRWATSKDVSADIYRITMNVNDGARVWIDDILIIDQWRPGPTRSVSADVNLVAGTHNFRVEYFNLECPAVIQAFALPLQSFPNWRGQYFDNPSVAGEPLLVRNDPAINFNWDTTSPVPGVIPDDNYSVRWTQTVEFVDGNYLFRVDVAGGVRIWLDGQILIDSWVSEPERQLEAAKPLSRGGHSLRVEYFKQAGDGIIRFGWAKLAAPDEPPTAVINGPTRATAGQLVGFNAVGSTVAEGSSIVSNAWTFGDDSTADGIYVTHAYNSPGIYEVTLTVTDDKGLSDTSRQNIEIVAAATPQPGDPPTAVIVAPSKAQVGDVVTFDASYSICPNPCISYDWDLGDGTRANAIKLQHVYERPAIYNVILVVTDDQGLQSTTNAQIEITEAAPVPTATPAPDQPVAVISALSEAAAGQPVTFDGSNSQPAGSIVSYAWQFGDGGTANAVTVEHSYATAGIYNVTLTVTDDKGVPGTSTQQIEIIEARPPEPTEAPPPEPTEEPPPEPTEEPAPEPTEEPPPEPTEELPPEPTEEAPVEPTPEPTVSE